MSIDTQAATLKGLIATAAKVPAYDLDDVPSPPPANYIEVYLSPRSLGNPRLDGTVENVGYRLSTRVVASTISNGRLAEDRIKTLFNLATHVLDGESAYVVYESGGGDFSLDNGFYTALTDWTYVR